VGERERTPNELHWTADLASDLWIHPLAGPVRRMPIRDSRVFGAERAGDRPPECYSGHCGVDIGGDVWGEPVLAAHDGVVDRIQPGPNVAHGGLYVRLSHRGGAVFTQYFHLAAIPRRLTPGTEVQAGEVIGLVGDSGVHNSGPHLHFTISVRPSADAPEHFIDPEPLIALWPVSIPIYGTTASIASAHVVPGRPVGAVRRPKKARRRPAPAATIVVDPMPPEDRGAEPEGIVGARPPTAFPTTTRSDASP
jgi:murein DD-endopeptidase MepM/ murein hydrolase activator NlpD